MNLILHQHSTSTAENFVFNPIQDIDHDNYDRKAYVKMSELINRKTGASLNRALYARRRLEPFEKIIYYIKKTFEFSNMHCPDKNFESNWISS